MPDPFLRYLRSRQKEHYEEVLASYGEPVLRLLRRLAPAGTVEDCAQEVFLRLASVKLDPEAIEQPRAFILRVAFHVARERAKADAKRARHERNAAGSLHPVEPSCSEALVLKERVSEILAAIDALPEKLRVPFHLRAVEGMSYKEIAHVLGVSVDVVGMRVLRARQRLRKVLDGTVSLLWLAVLPARGKSGALAATRELGSWVPGWGAGPAVRAESSGRLSLGLGITCVCIGVLGFLSSMWGTIQQEGAVSVMNANLEPATQPTIGSKGSASRTRTGPSQPRSIARQSVTSSKPQRQGLPAIAESTSADSSSADRVQGESDMSSRASTVASVLLTLAAAATAQGAQLGDFNDDGRLSLSDAYFYAQWAKALKDGVEPPFEPALDFGRISDVFPCTNASGEPWYLVAQEVLRRSSPAPLPHFLEQWPGPHGGPPGGLQRDGAVVVRVEDATVDPDSSLVEIVVHVENSVAIDFAGFVLRADGVELRPAHPSSNPARPGYAWPNSVETETYLLSGGFLSTVFGLGRPLAHLPGSRRFVLPAEVPLGTPAGSYAITLSDTTEVVTSGGQIVLPELVAGTLTLPEESKVGHALPFPPIDFDLEQRSIGGSFEARVSSIEGRPNDQAAATIQVRANRPVNFVSLEVRFDSRSVTALDARGLYPDPDLGQVTLTDFDHSELNGHPVLGPAGSARITYHAQGLRQQFVELYGGGDRQTSVRYLAPLGEWIDYGEINFAIKGDPAGTGESPLELVVLEARFTPYLEHNPGLWGRNVCDESIAFWSYESPRMMSGKVVIKDAPPPVRPEPPIPPEVAAIVFTWGEAVRKPGELVRVPVSLEAAVDLYRLDLIVGHDPDHLQLQGFDLRLESPDGQQVREMITPLERPSVVSRQCEGEGLDRVCVPGRPATAALRGTGTGDQIPEGSSARAHLVAWW